MLRFIELLAEEAIQKAMREGQFDGLPGRGKPLPDEDIGHVPPELRMAYKILKNAGCLPPELEAEKEILNVADMLAGIRGSRTRRKNTARCRSSTRSCCAQACGAAGP